jgi:tetracycline repressor-like protein
VYSANVVLLEPNTSSPGRRPVTSAPTASTLLAAADWADAIRRSAISLHDALDRHPWATTLLTSPAGIRPARLEYMDSLLARLEDAGFSDEACYHDYHVLDAYIVGFSLWVAGHSLTAAEEAVVRERVAREFSIEDFPRLVKHYQQHRTEGPHREVSAFELGLDVMLEGLKEMLKDEQSNRGNRPRT